MRGERVYQGPGVYKIDLHLEVAYKVYNKCEILSRRELMVH